jgi:hypothetical protein
MVIEDGSFNEPTIELKEEKKKKEEPEKPSEFEKEDKLENTFTLEMGFSMVAECMIASLKNKPLVGHNLMYDMLYFYNQFVDVLPKTYKDFIYEWSKIFPQTFDTKVFAYRN